MAAVTGRLPAVGDLVWITERALLRPGDQPVRRWRVIAAELDPERPGCCRLLGWDADHHGQPGHEGETWRTARIDGLTIHPANDLSDPSSRQEPPDEIEEPTAVPGPATRLSVTAFVSDRPDLDVAAYYAELLLRALPRRARQHWETHMSECTYEYQSHYARRLRADGVTTAFGEVLDARGWEVTDKTWFRIIRCRDIDQLKRWVRRAVTAPTLDEVFD
ncbi:hypothetical protein [Actinocatenispora sera]|uniref:Uncharacterized protein n=1 Tax=Actinocatenispora sera TaxID=390989 RepID=A0A810KWV9_9ACTN|nr:hypothetical protein [Actinocatenispora sera]BCJ27720.1 hypothetical protein Asera_18280 [Actinocatenispora sera]